MKNVIFDLGGVVVARKSAKMTAEFKEFFLFLADHQMPHYWEEYDRGTQSLEQTIDTLASVKGCSRELCRHYVLEAINMQEEIEATAALIGELSAQGYRLLVLSNMSLEFIRFIRQLPVYAHFVGEVVSCEEGVVKPEAEIFQLLIDRYDLDPAESIFVDDRAANIEAAAAQGFGTVLFKRWEAEASCQAVREALDAK